MNLLEEAKMYIEMFFMVFSICAAVGLAALLCAILACLIFGGC